MSRNLAMIDCYFCREDRVKLFEKPRPISEIEAGRYFSEYEGMLVARAYCELCDARYLAWVDESTRKRTPTYRDHLGLTIPFALRVPHEGYTFFDLSFRSTFNDEPGEKDYPQWKIEKIVTFKKTPWLTKDCHHG